MKKTNLSRVREAVLGAAQAAGFDVSAADIHLQPSPALAHGHLACNLAMLLGGKVGKKPMEVAKQIVARLQDPLIPKAEIADPGFINLWIEQKFYTTEGLEFVADPEAYLRRALEPAPKTVVIEYSSPNIAKPLGVHHLLSTIIGESLKRIHKAYGHRVVAENYPGDIGTQFGKLIHAIKTWGEEKKIEQNPIDELLALYVKFHDEAEKNLGLEEAARAEYKKFEEGDATVRALWKKIVDWSFQEIQPLYDRLDIHFDGVHGESFFENRMVKILEEGRRKGIFVDGERGAWIVRPDNPEDPPAMVKKADGTTLYLTRDLAQMAFFEETYHPDAMVWVVDVAQALHFKQRFEVCRKLGLTSAELVHVNFGRMEFADKGMSTRKGNIIRLSELLDEAEKRAEALAAEKSEGLSDVEKKALARLMGLGAVKYNILSQNRIQNIAFDWDKMLSIEGNSAPYLMYTLARAKSIFRKGGCDPRVAAGPLELQDDREVKLVLDCFTYPQAFLRAAEEYKPNHIANHLYRLAQSFNSFYNALPVLQAEEGLKNSRLLLTAFALGVLEHGLDLLGIKTPEKM